MKQIAGVKNDAAKHACIKAAAALKELSRPYAFNDFDGLFERIQSRLLCPGHAKARQEA
jgi:hypothetical protein